MNVAHQKSFDHHHHCFHHGTISSSKCLGLVTLLRKTSNALLASLWSRFSLQYILFDAFSILFSGILSFLLYLTLKLKNRMHKECSNLMYWCFCFIFPTQTKERGRGGAGSVNINIVFLLQIFLSNTLYQWGVESTVESSVDSEDGNWWILYAAIGGALLLLLLVIGVVGCVVCCRKRFFILTVDLIGITSVCCERSDHHHSCLFSFSPPAIRSPSEEEATAKYESWNTADFDGKPAFMFRKVDRNIHLGSWHRIIAGQWEEEGW